MVRDRKLGLFLLSVLYFALKCAPMIHAEEASTPLDTLVQSKCYYDSPRNRNPDHSYGVLYRASHCKHDGQNQVWAMGRLREEFTCENGVKHGQYRTYYFAREKNQRFIRVEANLVRGKLYGQSRQYWFQGDLCKVHSWQADMLHGTSYRDDDDRLLIYEYRNDSPTGFYAKVTGINPTKIIMEDLYAEVRGNDIEILERDGLRRGVTVGRCSDKGQSVSSGQCAIERRPPSKAEESLVRRAIDLAKQSPIHEFNQHRRPKPWTMPFLNRKEFVSSVTKDTTQFWIAANIGLLSAGKKLFSVELWPIADDSGGWHIPVGVGIEYGLRWHKDLKDHLRFFSVKALSIDTLGFQGGLGAIEIAGKYRPLVSIQLYYIGALRLDFYKTNTGNELSLGLIWTFSDVLFHWHRFSWDSEKFGPYPPY